MHDKTSLLGFQYMIKRSDSMKYEELDPVAKTIAKQTLSENISQLFLLVTKEDIKRETK